MAPRIVRANVAGGTPREYAYRHNRGRCARMSRIVEFTDPEWESIMAALKNAPTIEHSAAIAAYANAKKIDATKAGKLFRAKLRANVGVITENGGVPHAKNAPWAPHPRKALAQIFPDVDAFGGS